MVQRAANGTACSDPTLNQFASGVANRPVSSLSL